MNKPTILVQELVKRKIFSLSTKDKEILTSANVASTAAEGSRPFRWLRTMKNVHVCLMQRPGDLQLQIIYQIPNDPPLYGLSIY